MDPHANLMKREDEIFAIIHGSFQQPDIALAFADRMIDPDDKGRFQVEVPITGSNQTIFVHQVNFLGDVEPESGKLIVLWEEPEPKPSVAPVAQTSPQVARPKRENSAPPVLRADSLGLSIGLNLISLSEGSALQYSEDAISVGLSYEHRFLNSDQNAGFFGLGAVINKTFIAFGKSGSSLSMGLFDAEAYGSYSFPKERSPWRFGVRVGTYYVTTDVPGNSFGFHNLFGPEAYPVASYWLPNHDVISGVLGYAPVLNNVHGLTFSDTSLKIGICYEQQNWSYSGEFRSLKITDSGPGTVQLQDFRFSVGFHF